MERLVSFVRRVAFLCAAVAVISPAQTFTTVFSFEGANGASPYAGLVQGTHGELYGTTASGGAHGFGTVFKITPSGTLTTLYSFCSLANCADGSVPYAGLVQATNGDLYGTTDGGEYDGGTVFKMTPSGTLTTLYSFCSLTNCADGYYPSGGLIQVMNGDLYGTTSGGGAKGSGTVFKMSPSGTLTTVYSFCSLANCADGENPAAGLVQAASGDFYGTTYLGGANCTEIQGCGTIFKMTPSGTLTTLYSFCLQGDFPGCADGENPNVVLVQATGGGLYGTTGGGGASGFGTVFRFSPGGSLTTLYSFCSLTNCDDGQNPQASLVQATNGEFYGTTVQGGPNSAGTIFQITPSGTLTTIYSFCSLANCADGRGAHGLVQATNGNLYGTTASTNSGPGDGTVYRLSVGLGPFVEPQRTSGKVGAIIKILGTDL